eukprot:75409-Hanusia_phi.AAC.2
MARSCLLLRPLPPLLSLLRSSSNSATCSVKPGCRLEGLRKEEEETSRKEEEEQEKLRRAAATGDSETVRRLLESKAHPTVGEDKSASVHAGISALHVAANARQPEIVGMLLEAKAQPNAKMFFYKRTPAHCAAAAGCHEVSEEGREGRERRGGRCR